jgi:CelD/BcsL family acetyltransferase involved in cellulose biosynthesis
MAEGGEAAGSRGEEMTGRAAPPVPAVHVVRDDGELAALSGEWDELLASSSLSSPFLTWPWVSAWRDTLGRQADLVVAVARDPDDGRLVGIAPFAVGSDRKAGINHRVLRFVGGGPAAPDHLDLVIRTGHEAAAAPALWSAVRRAAAADLYDLDGLRPDSVLAGIAARRNGDVAAIERISCPYLPLPPTWEEYEATLGKNLRQNLRRYARKLDADAGASVVERMVCSAAEVDATMSALGDLHQQVRSARGQQGAFRTPMLRAFHHAAARRFHAAGRLRLHRLDIDHEPVAVIYCFRYGDTVSFYSTGYDRRWARYGPGRRIMAYAIRSAIDEGATGFDFLRGDESYKEHWRAEARYDLRLFTARTVRGRTLLAMRSAWRRLEAFRRGRAPRAS